MTTETLDALAPYAPIKADIAKFKKENATLVFDYESAKGNKLARSHVAQLRTLKGEIERKRVALKAEALAFGKKVDGAAREMTGEVEQMIEVHAKPLADIEAREAAKLASIAMPLDPIKDAFSCEEIIERIGAVVIDDSWPSTAKKIRENTMLCLEARLAELTKAEAAAAELEKLRADKEAREKADADAAREKARAAREAEIAKQAAERAVAAERERALAAEAKAAREAAAAKAEEEKRAANKKHRAKILGEVSKAIEDIVGDTLAYKVTEALEAGKIPHTTIKF